MTTLLKYQKGTLTKFQIDYSVLSILKIKWLVIHTNFVEFGQACLPNWVTAVQTKWKALQTFRWRKQILFEYALSQRCEQEMKQSGSNSNV